jgi:integrase
MAVQQGSFRVGKVRGDLRGKVWYLTYFEDGRRRRPRVGPDKVAAKQMAAQICSQLEIGAPAALSFEADSLDELQARWLSHHEQVLRSSVQTIQRYRTATQHLLRFVEQARVPRTTSHFRAPHAEEFVSHLRTVQVAPNGHAHSEKRPLLDKGIKFILETCRAMFNFAIKRRHLSPYAENPFAVIDLDRIPVEHRRPIVIFSADEERRFFEQCDDWQFPIFATLAMTGMRPGELCHLLLPKDIDLTHDLVFIRNKPQLGWQVKTRNERAIPIVPPLRDLLRHMIGNRREGPVFLRRRFASGEHPPLGGLGSAQLADELLNRIARRDVELQRTLSRQERLALARHLWTDAGAIKPDRLHWEFLRITRAIVKHIKRPQRSFGICSRRACKTRMLIR